MWGRGQEGAMALAPLSARFQSLPSIPTIKLGPSSADSRVGGLVNTLGPYGSLQRTLLWGWEFLLLLPQPPWVFSLRGLRLYFPELEPWVAWSVTWSTSCCLAGQLQFCPPCSTIHHLTEFTSRSLAVSPLRPVARLCPFYRSGWMFLLYLLGCRTYMQFVFLSVLVVFCFKLLLSFFWLYEEAPCFYLCLHLGWMSECGSFKSLVVGLSYSSIFCQFWLFFCF